MSDPLAVAIAGLDSPYWPDAFVQQTRSREDATLVGFTALDAPDEAVVESIGRTPDEFADAYDVERLADLDAAIDAADALLVCTRNSRMADALVPAVEAGRDAFAAKPIAVDVADLAAIRDALDGADVAFTGGQTARSDPATRTVLDLAAAGRLGDVHAVRVMHQHGRYAGWADGTWYTDPGEGNACHWLGWYPLDVAVAALGPIEALQGDARQLATDYADQPDHLSAIAHHGSDRASTLSVYCDVGGDWDVELFELEVVGSEGIARYCSPDEYVRLHADGGVRRIDVDGPDPLATDLGNWIAACRGDGVSTLPADEALHVAAAGCAWDDARRDEDGRVDVELRI